MIACLSRGKKAGKFLFIGRKNIRESCELHVASKARWG